MLTIIEKDVNIVKSFDKRRVLFHNLLRILWYAIWIERFSMCHRTNSLMIRSALPAKIQFYKSAHPPSI